MERFDDADLFDRPAEAGKLDRAMLEVSADKIAVFHDQAEPTPAYGDREA